MSSPEVERRLRQQGADVDALYEISTRIESKVDGLDDKVDRLTDSTNTRLDTLAQETTARFDTLTQDTNVRFDSLERETAQNRALLEQILARLDR